MNRQDRIEPDPNVLTGKPVIKGTRIAVEFVVELLGNGWSMDQVLAESPHATAEDVRACLLHAGEILKSESAFAMPL